MDLLLIENQWILILLSSNKQTVGFMSRIHEHKDIRRITLFFLLRKDVRKEGACVYSVSYTHLDVYKRQDGKCFTGHPAVFEGKRLRCRHSVDCRMTYASPIGKMLLSADDEGLTGAWFLGQKYYASRSENACDVTNAFRNFNSAQICERGLCSLKQCSKP